METNKEIKMKQQNVIVLEREDLQLIIAQVTQQKPDNITLVGDVKEIAVSFVFNTPPTQPTDASEQTKA